MKKTFYLFMLVFALSACKKDWLSEKRDISVIIPSTLKDLRLLLNNEFILNTDTRELVESSSDEIFLTKSQLENITPIPEHNALIWNKDIYQGTNNVTDWDNAYKAILYTNVILEMLSKIERKTENSTEHDAIKGGALFFRARAFLNLAMTFAKYYDPATANTDLGIPLKLSADINEKISRASVQQTYDRILEDLNTAVELLPITSGGIKTDASKLACYGLLARCYLYMDKYDLALQAATKSFSINSYLLDFNTLNPSLNRPFPTTNGEIHFYGIFSTLGSNTGYSYMTQELFDLYTINDLRKTCFFRSLPDGGIHFKGSYHGTSGNGSGVATGEILLISAECKAQLSDISGAMEDLNLLLVKRYKTGTFLPYTASNKENTLEIIRTERRKELVRRGLRFQDLKRYNRDPELAKTLTKTIDGVTYSLPPNDPRYVLPIPDYIIQFNGIQQNPR